MTDWEPTGRQVEAAAEAIADLVTQKDASDFDRRLAKAALIAAEQAAWGDIETAPKDREIMLQDESSMALGQWVRDHGANSPGYWAPLYRARKWRERPLPAPPQESET